jgi:hypothetical protein
MRYIRESKSIDNSYPACSPNLPVSKNGHFQSFVPGNEKKKTNAGQEEESQGAELEKSAAGTVCGVSRVRDLAYVSAKLAVPL